MIGRRKVRGLKAGKEQKRGATVGWGPGHRRWEQERGCGLVVEEAGLEPGAGQPLEPGDHPPLSATMDTGLTCVT